VFIKTSFPRPSGDHSGDGILCLLLVGLPLVSMILALGSFYLVHGHF